MTRALAQSRRRLERLQKAAENGVDRHMLVWVQAGDLQDVLREIQFTARMGPALAEALGDALADNRRLQDQVLALQADRGQLLQVLREDQRRARAAAKLLLRK
jgi:hypothetical protein